MSRPEAPGLIPMTITAEDKAAEIFVLDGNLNMAARGIGTLRTELPEGIYKIKLRAGADTREDLVVHRAPRTDKQYPLLRFSSPAPLAFTLEGSPDHAEAAKRESHVVHVHRGAGSSIFVFARDWVSGQGPGPSGLNPAEDLHLESSAGGLLVDLETQSIRQDGVGGPWAACTIELDPGPYRLSVRLSNGEVFVQSIVASPGWQTQVFMLQRKDYRRTSGEARPNLGSAAILMSRDMGFDPDAPSARVAELARQGLVNRRPVLSNETREMLRQKAYGPMLGIFAGHLLLQEPPADLSLLTLVVQNLRILLGAPHPDVEALALAAGVSTDFSFAMPPMLRRSWSCVVEASAKRPELVPAESLASRLFLKLTNQDPWLVWREQGQDTEHELVENFTEVLKRLIERPGGLKEVAASIARHAREESAGGHGGLLGGVVRTLEQAAAGVTGDPSRRPSALVPASIMEALVESLGIPRSSVEAMIDQGLRRLKIEG